MKLSGKEAYDINKYRIMRNFAISASRTYPSKNMPHSVKMGNGWSAKLKSIFLES